jgi:hypothetical protein
VTLGDRATLRRAGALLILALLVMAFWVGPVSAYFDLIDDGAVQIAAKAAILARYRALTRSDPTAPTAAAGLIYPDIAESQAVAMLQETVKGAAAAAQVQIQGLQVLRGEDIPGATRIGVRIRAAGDVAGLRGLIHAIETARPILYPDNLQIQSHAMSPGAAPAPLDFSLDISGFKPGPGS